jgi:hypothetical protein
MAVISLSNGEIPDSVMTRDMNGDATLKGIFEAKELVAGAYAVKNSSGGAKTMGEAIIGLDKSNNVIETKAVTENSKIFVTFESDPGSRFWIEKEKDETTGEYTGFKVNLSDSAKEDVRFSWWIVEEK